MRHFQTFIPAQDKNKIYKSDKKLCELASNNKFSGSFGCHSKFHFYLISYFLKR
ncbi:hypothetical protein [Campylobacter concisus]